METTVITTTETTTSVLKRSKKKNVRYTNVHWHVYKLLGGGLGVQLDMHVRWTYWTYWNRNFSSETLVQSFDKHCEMSYIVVVEPTSMTKLIAHPVYRWLAIKVCLSSQQQSNNRNNWNNSLTEQISDSPFAVRNSQFASSKSIFDDAFRKTTRISCCSVYQVNKGKGSSKELLRIELRSERARLGLVTRDSR